MQEKQKDLKKELSSTSKMRKLKISQDPSDSNILSSSGLVKKKQPYNQSVSNGKEEQADQFDNESGQLKEGQQNYYQTLPDLDRNIPQSVSSNKTIQFKKPSIQQANSSSNVNRQALEKALSDENKRLNEQNLDLSNQLEMQKKKTQQLEQNTLQTCQQKDQQISELQKKLQAYLLQSQNN